MKHDELSDVLDVATRAIDSAELPTDHTDAEHLLRAAQATDDALESLLTRLRAVANSDCEPPDLRGLCMACGRKIAEPVPAAKHGCDPFAIVIWPAARLRRLAIRVTRLGRLFWAAARNRGHA